MVMPLRVGATPSWTTKKRSNMRLVPDYETDGFTWCDDGGECEHRERQVKIELRADSLHCRRKTG